MHPVRAAVRILREEGPLGLADRLARRLLRSGAPESPPPPACTPRYDLWLERTRPTAADLARMREAVAALAYQPVISVVMPVFEAEEEWLRRAIESVMGQAYPLWELCIAYDASTAPRVRRVLDEYAARDVRIKSVFLARNAGIAGASNRALEIASGEFVAFLDHDDELAPEALFEVARLLNEDRDLDLIYSDETSSRPAILARSSPS